MVERNNQSKLHSQKVYLNKIGNSFGCFENGVFRSHIFDKRKKKPAVKRKLKLKTTFF